MGMLTDYEYTNDVTSDAGGAPETFGPEAGYGIISPLLMCQWVIYNCHESCECECVTIRVNCLRTLDGSS